MQRLYLIIIFLFTATAVKPQYKNDNVKYTTIDPAELGKMLQAKKKYLLLDVRSPGEFNDTSQYLNLNLGRLKGAVNIDISELPKRINEISGYRNSTVIVYCSHSQRSRKACNLLADSGFLKVYNVNGGITSMHYRDILNASSLGKWYATNNKYRLVAPQTICKELRSNPEHFFVLDVRPDSVFNRTSGLAKDNAIGYFTNTMHLPVDILPERLQQIPVNKTIIITDIYGKDAAKAAVILAANHFDDIQVMVEGFDRWLNLDHDALGCKAMYTAAAPFNIISAYDFGKLRNKENMLMLDVRSKNEFDNVYKDQWRNIGRIKNAVNIPENELEKNVSSLAGYKDKPVIVYHFGSGTESYAAATLLTRMGFKNVNVLQGGIFNLRWTAANIKGQSHLTEWVTNIPDYNQ